MKYVQHKSRYTVLVGLLACSFPLSVLADASYDDLKAQVELLKKQLAQIQKTLAEQQSQTASKKDVAQLKQDVAAVFKQQSQTASKKDVAQLKQDVAAVSNDANEWKNSDSILHISGYGDATYSDYQHGNSAFNAVKFSPIFHYQYKDLVLMEAELETAVSEDGSSDIGVEYASLDYFLNDNMTLVGGKFLSPVGYFRQNRHPSWINKLPSFPVGFGENQAAPNGDVGLQLRGGSSLSNDSRFVNYVAYVANGPTLELDGSQIAEINTSGSTSNADNKFVYGGRLGFLPIPMLEIGVSGATGKVAGAGEPNATRNYDVYGMDLNYKWNNFHLFSEYVTQKVGAASNSAAPNSASWDAWYAEASYRFLPTGFEGVVRYGDYNTPNKLIDQRQLAIGVNYLFSSNAMAKFAYQFNHGASGSTTNDDLFQAQLSYGF